MLRRIRYLNNLGYSSDFIWTRVYCTVIYILKCYFRIICCWKCEMYKLKNSGGVSQPWELKYTCFYLFYIRGDIICMDDKTIHYEDRKDLITSKISVWVSSIFFNFYEVFSHIKTFKNSNYIYALCRLLQNDIYLRHLYYVRLTVK